MKRIFAVMFIFIWSSAFCLLHDPRPAVAAGDDQIYAASVPPLVMLVMGRNHKLYYEAYNDASDLDGDGTLDVGYKPNIDYYGYFDSYKVYSYNSTNSRFEPLRFSANKKKTPGANEWSGDFLNYLTMSRMDTLRKVLYGGYRSTDTATETVLQRVYVPQDAHSWGKEYESIARDGYDIREYTPLNLPAAGTRHLFASTTLSDNGDPLLRVLPNNIHRIWEWVAKERPVADDSLESGAGSHPGHPETSADYEDLVLTYAVPANQLGSAAPDNGRIDGAGNPFGDNYNPYDQNASDQENYLTIFSGRLNVSTGGDYQFAVDGDDAVEVIIDGTVVAGWYGGHGKCNCQDHVGTITLSAGDHDLEFRHEEAWGGDNYYLYWNGPDSGNVWQITPSTALVELSQSVYSLVSPGSTIRDYVVRVQVGVDGLQEANCRRYPNNAWKPAGILQKYGESGKMYFGLLTGSYAKNTSGGVLRKAIGPISDEIDANTGQFTATNGIISTINKFRILKYRYSDYSYDPGWDGAWVTTRPMNEGEFPDWGNPVAEMMYEGLRYFAGKGIPTDDFRDATMTEDDALGLPNAAWDNPFVTNSPCAKPFMLVLTDINPTYDSDQLPGSYFGSAPTPNDMTDINVATIGSTIFQGEPDLETGSYYIGQQAGSYDGSCAPKTVSSFSDIRGLCEEEPTKQGSYYSASISHYGRTHDVNSAPGTQNVLSYMVGLASPLPRINIPVGNHNISLVPFAKSVGGCLGINGSEGSFQPTNTIVDFFVERISPTSGRFRINYEDVEQAADHDMDAIVIYDYQLVDSGGSPVSDPENGTAVRITLSSEYAAGCIIQHVGYIISGTTADGTYLEVRDYDTSADEDVDYFLDTPAGQSIGGISADGIELPLTTTRTFTPGETNGASLLRNPLWYSAKWGGFNDFNGNGQPDLEAEWDENSDGIPDTYYYVVNPLKLEQQLSQSFADILSRGVSHVAPVVSVDEANRTQSGSEIYVAFFKPMENDYWQGNLKKYGLSYIPRTDCNRADSEWTLVDQNNNIAEDPTTCDGQFNPQSDSYWSTNDGGYVDKGGVGGVLKTSIDNVTIGGSDTYDFRKIYTYIDGSLVKFDRNHVLNAHLDVNEDAARYRIINFMYGYINDADDSGNPTDKRDWILGDIIHSEPKIIDYLNTDGSLQYRYVAVGSNDGMLHVFMVYPDNGTFYINKAFSSGQEIFAFIPSDLLPKLKDLTDPSTRMHAVDGSSNLLRSTTKTGDYYNKTLVFGERRGGRSYWALDVTQPDPSLWTVKWHVEGGTGNFAEMGQSWSKPYFAKLRTDSNTVKDVVILSGGYDILEDAYPEVFEDEDNDGVHDSAESFSNTLGGTSNYDTYNPGKDTMGRGIFVVDISDGSVLFKATYGDADNDEDEGEDVTTGIDQKYCKMKYAFPADVSVIPFSESKIIMYAADIYGQIWKIFYNYYGDTAHSYTDTASTKWKVKRIFSANPASSLASHTYTGDPDAFSAGGVLNTYDQGRKMFYSPDISYFGNCWTSKPVLYFGTGDRAHPRYSMISNRFYVLADHNTFTDENDLLNLTCDELDQHADADGDGDVDTDDATRREALTSILKDETISRGFYRVLDGQTACVDETENTHAGEKILSQPTVFFKNVYFTSYQPAFDDPCNPNGNAFSYAVDYCWGKSVFNYHDEGEGNPVVRNILDTYLHLQNSSIPSGVRVITRGGHAAGLISAGGTVRGVGEDQSTNIPGPPGGVSQLLWETW